VPLTIEANRLRIPKWKQTLFALITVAVAGSSVIQFEGIASAQTKPNLSNSLVAQNSEPIVKWTTTQPVERPLNVITLQAVITPSTHLVMKACLTSHDLDGQNIEEVRFPLEHAPWSTVNCQYFGTGQEGWSVPGISTPKVMNIPVDTYTGWPTRARVLTLTVTDAVAQEHKTSITIPAVNHNRRLTPEGIGTGVFGRTEIGISETNRVGSLNLYGTYKNLCVKAFNNELCTKTGDYGYLFKDYRLMTNINTACTPNGVHTVTMSGVSHRDEPITETYNLTTANPKPKIDEVSFTNKRPAWNNKTVSTSLDVWTFNGCNYSIHLTGGGSTKTYKGIVTEGAYGIDSGQVNITFGKLKPRTRYTAKVTVSSPQGKRVVTKTFTTARIPSRPSGGSGSGGGSGVGGINFVGWNLAEVRSIVGYAYSARQASSCSQYGMENGLLGIRNESNWTVVGQSGSTLYVCKR
jgi:hypothetical protein